MIKVYSLQCSHSHIYSDIDNWSVNIYICHFLLCLHAERGKIHFKYKTFCCKTNYSPKVHEEDLNFQFNPCLSSPGPCGFLNTSLELDRRKHKLMVGQPYKISMTLEMPESSANQAR